MPLLYEDIKRDQLANPPQYDERGMLVRRYTQPSAAVAEPPAVPTPTADTSADYTIKTPEQFAAERGGSVDEAAIREQTRKNMQAAIDAINTQFANLVTEQERKNEGYMGQTRAVNARSGTLGSDFGNANMAGQEKANSQAVKALRDEQAVKIAEVNGRIDEIARADIAAKKQEAAGNAEAYATYLEQQKTDARGTLETLAKAGTDISQLDAKRKAYLFKAAGYDGAMGELVYNSLKPKAGQIDYKAEKAADGKILLYGVDPTTGQLKSQRINFDVPEGYEATYVDGKLMFKNAAGDLIPAPMDQSLYTNDYKNYLLSKGEGYAGSFEQWQTTDANRKRPVTNTYITSGDGYNLNTKEQANLNAIIAQHQKSPLIAGADKATVFRGIAKDAETNLKDATKQLATIYAFVKILDNYESAVREGEITLSQQAMGVRQKLETAIAKLNDGQIVDEDTMKSYIKTGTAIADSLAEAARAKDKQYEAQAKVNGENVLNAWKDYRSSYTSSFDEPAGEVIVAPDGQEIIITDN